MSYAPGGWGAFLALARDPANRSQWLAGADVGGLFVSLDDGVSWRASNSTEALVSSLVVAPRSTTVVAALSAADYYDGYLPPGLLVSTDGARSFGFERRLSNHNVVSLAVDARGRVCAATNGNGYQCVQIGWSE